MMQLAEVTRKPAPGWITWLFLVGAVLLFVWGWFVLGFLAEPSAVGGVRVALLIIGGGSLASAVLGVLAAAGLIKGARWSSTVALVAALVMILSVMGAVMGIPAVMGLMSGRTPGPNSR